MTLQITVKNDRAELLTFYELLQDEQDDFAYVDSEGRGTPRFVRIDGDIIDVNEMVLIDPNTRLAELGWHGSMTTSMWSADLVMFPSDDDGMDDDGFVRIGRATW